jgi:hypothetical protein
MDANPLAAIVEKAFVVCDKRRITLQKYVCVSKKQKAQQTPHPSDTE